MVFGLRGFLIDFGFNRLCRNMVHRFSPEYRDSASNYLNIWSYVWDSYEKQYDVCVFVKMIIFLYSFVGYLL